jgi:hypothetical protein
MRENKKFLLLIILTFSSLMTFNMPNLVSANFYPTPSVYVTGYNPTYPNGTSYTFTIDVHISMDAPAINNISYSLDGEENITLSNIEYTTWYPTSTLPNNLQNYPHNHQIFSVTENLHILETGNHTIDAYAIDSTGKVLSGYNYFTIGCAVSKPHIPTSSPSHDFNITPITRNPTVLTIIASVFAVLCVAFVSLVYFKRRKGKK